MEYRDYYKIMGLERSATQDEIKRSYRKLARKFHPDVSKEPDAEARFKELGEAYAVLKDAEKRAAYDELGANWQAGNEFRPPPDWGNGFEFTGRGDGGAEDHSDFFEALFGHATGRAHETRNQRGFRIRGEDHHAKVSIDLEDAYSGATRTIVLRSPEVDSSGHVVTKERTLNVNVPKGVRQGQRIRLPGQGSPGHGGGATGDLFLEIEFRPHRLYTSKERDVFLNLPLTPWEAALGATVKVPTPAGTVDLKIPPDTGHGRKLRLRGRGIPGEPAGDFFVNAEITLPPADSEQAEKIYKKMQQEMAYNPRDALEG